MNIQDHILILVTKKLASEASNDELLELDELLQQYPDIYDNVRLITEWWHKDIDQNTDANSYSRFQKVIGKIKCKRSEE
ncbi:MAG: hypothetical protein JO080_05845 [Mucilaginibacter sp.]|nr:hypothetical protein [Mucilaginibacter sp.]